MIERRSVNSAMSSRLPPYEVAPMLEYAGRGHIVIPDEYKIEAPVDDRGIVLPEETIRLVMETTDPDYRWPIDKCDIHHFVWQRSRYSLAANNGDPLPQIYSNIAVHKGYLPRQLHNYIHAIVMQPDVPDYEVMENRVRAYHLAEKLFQTARQAIKFDKNIKHSVLLNDKPSKRNGNFTVDNEIELDILYDAYERFYRKYHDQLQDLDEQDLAEFGIDIYQSSLSNLARQLGRVAGITSLNLMPQVSQFRVVA